VIKGVSINAKKTNNKQSNKKLTPCSIKSFETRKLGDGSSPRHVIDSQGAH
jgi:hypothetical protein